MDGQKNGGSDRLKLLIQGSILALRLFKETKSVYSKLLMTKVVSVCERGLMLSTGDCEAAHNAWKDVYLYHIYVTRHLCQEL